MRASVAAAVLSVVSAQARGAAPPDEPILHRIFFAASAGATEAFFAHPMLTGQALVPSYSLQGGLALSPHFLVSLEFDGISRHVQRKSEQSPFSLYASPAACTSCADPGQGASPLDVNASFSSLSARFDVAPLGLVGPYAAGLLGMAITQGLYVGAPPEVGLSAGARLGFRYRVNRTLEVLAELGFQGQWYEHARLLLPSGQAMVRLYL